MIISRDKNRSRLVVSAALEGTVRLTSKAPIKKIKERHS